MKTRSEELRDRNRKVFAWSLAIAAAIHVALFLWLPAFDAQPLVLTEIRNEGDTQEVGTPTFVDVLFGPPAILAADGTVSTEPLGRVLQADRLVHLPTECSSLSREGRTPAHGQVHLTVDASGRTDDVEIEESTGDACADEVLSRVASDLWYRWLPSEDFPAPVDLIQPITLAETRN